jgi:nucleoside-diphosphate kinase
MTVERTLAIIKPNAVEQKRMGDIIAMIEKAGLSIIAMKLVHLSRPQAEGFYAVHRERPFFSSLLSFMTRGPVVVMCLEGENAIRRYRDLMGATDPAQAADGTIRKRYGSSVEQNAVHGSDAPETARFEIGYFFPGFEPAAE